MPLSDIVNITITAQGSGVTQAGFGLPMILSPHSLNTDRVRFYDDTDGMVTDGFSPTGPEVLAATAAFAQEPHPVQVAVGRRANKPTQRYALTPVVVNASVYSVKVDGNIVSYTSDSSATATEIIAGLKTAIDGLSLPLTTSDQTTYLRALASTAGAWHNIETLTPDLLYVKQDHADPGLAADLAAIAAVDNTWYGVLNLFNSDGEVQAIAPYVEAHQKLFVAQVQDTKAIQSAYDNTGAADVLSWLKVNNYFRTAGIYHPNPGAFADAAWDGRCLPLDPGTETWKFKTLAGVASVALTQTQVTNLKNRNANYYYVVSGIAITADGHVAGGDWIDAIRGRDWLAARMGEGIFTLFTSVPKVPYTDKGVAVVVGEVKARLQDGVDKTVLNDNPAPTVTAPKVATIDSTDKTNRNLPDVEFTAELAGAIHAVELTGVISA